MAALATVFCVPVDITMILSRLHSDERRAAGTKPETRNRTDLSPIGKRRNHGERLQQLIAAIGLTRIDPSAAFGSDGHPRSTKRHVAQERMTAPDMIAAVYRSMSCAGAANARC